MEQSLATRVDERVAAQAAAGAVAPEPRRGALASFTTRITASLAIGIPLKAVGASLGGEYGHGEGAVLGIIAVMATILGLNIYYTKVEKSLELARLRYNKGP